ncbi:putative acyl-CoA oxidase, partial [Amylostereum chailletii]
SGLATEIVLGRYAMPPPVESESLLARHEASIQAELKEIMFSASNRRGSEVNRRILPRCQAFVEAIGHRMAYDAARAAGVMPALVDLYVASVVKFDACWYAEEGGLGRKAQLEMEERALDGVLPHIERLVDELNVKPYVTAPIVTDGAWDLFVEGLKTFEGPSVGTAPVIVKQEAVGLGRVSARL